MNLLVVGSDKTEILHHLPDTFLLIDDGPLIDSLAIPKRRKVTHFDFHTHSFDPLRRIDYRRAVDFVSVIDAAFPGGQNTLTKQNTGITLLEALLDSPKSLDALIRKSKETLDAYNKINRLLLSPVLSRVLTNPINFSLKGIVLARLPRASLGDFDAFVLGNLLVSLYPGQVVIPDFGFYGHRGHTQLIEQDRLVAGVNYLSESELEKDLLLIPNKIPSRCLPEDAETLADHAGIMLNTNARADFIQRSIT